MCFAEKCGAWSRGFKASICWLSMSESVTLPSMLSHCESHFEMCKNVSQL